MFSGVRYAKSAHHGEMGDRTGGTPSMSNVARAGGAAVPGGDRVASSAVDEPGRATSGGEAAAAAAAGPSTDAGSRSQGHADGQLGHYRLLRVALGVIRLGPVVILAGLIVAMTLASPVFLTTGNIGNVLSQTAVIAVLAVGQLLVVLTRGIDLSVGATLALASVVGAIAFDHGQQGPAVIGVMLATGAAVGFVNGAVYVWGRLPHPFIITLASLSIARGLALRLSEGQPKRGMPDAIRSIGNGSIGWLPYSAFLVAAIAVLVAVVLSRLVWGRWIYATGGNPEAARRTGIPVRPVLVSVYVMCGLLAGVAAIITSGRLNAGSPTAGSLAELDSIAAVIIGGASFLGGRGNVANALVGAVMIGVIRNGMNLLNVDAFLQPIVIGVVIVLAVEADVLRAWLEERFRVLQAALA
jgi:ribose transport system permease protein